MESKDLLSCAIVAVLGIISAAMGFAGEATRVKVSEIYIVSDTCVYPSSPALALGIVAAVFAIITRIYISVSFGGSGCCRSGPNSTPISKLFFVLSWVASVGAIILLLAAAGLNNREGGQIDSYGYITCYVVKPGIFAAGAILALLSAFLGIVAFIVTLSSTTQTTTHPSIGLPAAHANVDPEKFFYILSWVASVGAVLLLLAGLNHREGGQIDSYGDCTDVVIAGISAAGDILVLLSAVFGIVAYIVTLSSTTQTSTHPSIGLPAAHANVDLENYPQQYAPQQFPPQQYPPQHHLPQQYPPQQ